MSHRRSHLEDKIFFLVQAYQLPVPEREFLFHPTRKWRFDFAYPKIKVAIECEGAIWSFGRHTRGSGFVKDCDKYNSAALLGWRVLKYTTENYHQVVNDIKSLMADKIFL